MRVWSYWEGPRNPFIDTCIDSMRRVCDGFRLVTPETVPELVGDSLHPDYQLIDDIAMRAGAIRAAVLARHGGFWYDADTIAVRDPTFLLERYPDATAIYTTWDRPPLRVLNGYNYFSKDCDEAQDWLIRVNRRLQTQRLQPVVWTELGEQTLTPVLTQSRAAWRVARRIFLPVDVDSHVARYFEPGDPVSLIEDDTVCFGLNQSWFWCHKRAEMAKTPEQWARSPLLIHRLLTWFREKQ